MAKAKSSKAKALKKGDEEKAKYDITGFTKSTYSLHYYDSMLIIEKRKMDPPFSLDNHGKSEVQSFEFKKDKKHIKSLIKRLKNSIKNVKRDIQPVISRQFTPKIG